jgi:hypothetical protein
MSRHRQGVRENRLHIWIGARDARIDNIRAGRPVADEPAAVLADPKT